MLGNRSDGFVVRTFPEWGERDFMADSTIKAGDTVQLKSGTGPIMIAVGESMIPGNWVCEWFDAKNNPKKAQFALSIAR